VVDREIEDWEPDGLASLAVRYFRDKAYPLLYIDGTLAMMGGLPSRKNLVAMAGGQMEYGLSETDIRNAAKGMGYPDEGESGHE
jgi:hypothetical protein